MSRATIITLLFLALSWQVKAQQQTAKSSEIKRYKWDIGTDLLWLIDKNVVPPSVFVRLNTDKNNRLSAYRFRLGGNYEEHLNTVDSVRTTLIKSSLNAFISVGKEWHKQYDQFQFFYGSDIFLNYQRSIAEWDKDEKGYFPRDREISTGVSPLIGMRYFLNSKISFSTEAHFNIFFHQWYRKTNRNEYDGTLTVVEHRLDYLKMNINPFYTLNLHYHF